MTIDLRTPPSTRYDGSIIDVHCHFGSPEATDRMLEAGEHHGVRKWVGICRIDEVETIRDRLKDRAAFSVWIEHDKLEDAKAWTERNVRIVERAAEAGCHCIKFWYKPEFNHSSNLFWDNPRLDRVFEAMVDAGLPGLVHIADPDLWWRNRYADPDKFEAKRFTYRQLTNTLDRFDAMHVLVAHMGGWPENLPFLTDLLERYPNCYFDTSATKWVVRELSRRANDARTFFSRFQDRLLFGSDLVAGDNADVEHHCSRYWVHRFFYERGDTIRSPIEDPDADGPVDIVGLNLPNDVLAKLYRDNAVRFFGLADSARDFSTG